MDKVEADLVLLKWMVGINIALTIALGIVSFIVNTRLP
jgi:hypothetical protein